jgi:hypothetical protein
MFSQHFPNPVQKSILHSEKNSKKSRKLDDITQGRALSKKFPLINHQRKFPRCKLIRVIFPTNSEKNGNLV